MTCVDQIKQHLIRIFCWVMGRWPQLLGQSGDGAFSALVSKSAEHNPNGESLRQIVPHPGTGSTKVQGYYGLH